jgi:hypothetical protein
MGGAAPSSFKTIAINTGCSVACFEFEPDATPTSTAASDALLQAMKDVNWVDISTDLWVAVPSNQPLLKAVGDRIEFLALAHDRPFAAMAKLDLKGDKDPARARLSPFASAAVPLVGEGPLVVAIANGTLPMSDLHAMCDAIYLETTAVGGTTADVLLYDLLSIRAVYAAREAYATLFEHSAFWADGALKSAEAIQEEVVCAVALAAGESAIVIIAEAPKPAAIEHMFPTGQGWIEWSDTDPLNPLAIRAMGAVQFAGECTANFRPVVMGLEPGEGSWVDRLLAVRVRIADQVSAIVIGVHWHHTHNLHTYVACITALLHTAVAMGADLAILAGDFNFATEAEAGFVSRAVKALHGITTHPTSQSGNCLVTTRKTRSAFQAQVHKTGVVVAAPRLLEFRLQAAHSNFVAAGGIVAGSGKTTPSQTWPLDHGATVTVTALSAV